MRVTAALLKIPEVRGCLLSGLCVGQGWGRMVATQPTAHPRCAKLRACHRLRQAKPHSASGKLSCRDGCYTAPVQSSRWGVDPRSRMWLCEQLGLADDASMMPLGQERPEVWEVGGGRWEAEVGACATNIVKCMWP